MTCQDNRYTASMETRFRLEGKVQIMKLDASLVGRTETTAIHISGKDTTLVIITAYPRELVETLKRVIDGEEGKEWEAIL